MSAFPSEAMNCQDQAMSSANLMDECVCAPIKPHTHTDMPKLINSVFK